MSLFVASLNSGSNGNCYYVGNDQEAVLVDAGISCREVEKRMRGLGLDPAKLKALFISHEHTDHISGLPVLAKKYRLPVYITPKTYQGCSFLLEEERLHTFKAFEAVQVGGLSVTAFPKWHDAADPHSFIISGNGVTAGVFTDIGEPCKNVIHYFKQCHAIFLESNYDEEMLANSRYPVFLRNRISGKQGHLSNVQALQLFTAHKPAFMTHVFLSHLSKENNQPALATALFNQGAGAIKIIHAPRDGATALYHIQSTVASVATTPAPLSFMTAAKKKAAKSKTQLSLF
jgi:phosphoribosyl 1,2-cyclic phosphodiesterase